MGPDATVGPMGPAGPVETLLVLCLASGYEMSISWSVMLDTFSLLDQWLKRKLPICRRYNKTTTSKCKLYTISITVNW